MKMTPQFKRWFRNSKVVDANGNPLVVYHATTKDFDAFNPDKGQLGCHFGTLDQSHDIAKTVKDEWRHGTRLIPCYLSIQNPIRLTDTSGYWSFDDVIGQLMEMGIDTEDLEDGRDKNIRELLKKNGYDGVVYMNRREGVKAKKLSAERDEYLTFYAPDEEYKNEFAEATDSWIIFDAWQAKSAIANKGDYNMKHGEIGEGMARKVLKTVNEIAWKDDGEDDSGWVLMYHGSNSPEIIGEIKCPAYFTDSPQFATCFGAYLHKAMIYLEKPYIVDGNESGRHFLWSSVDVREMRQKGYDGVIVKSDEYPDIYTVFSPRQVRWI